MGNRGRSVGAGVDDAVVHEVGDGGKCGDVRLRFEMFAGVVGTGGGVGAQFSKTRRSDQKQAGFGFAGGHCGHSF